jgi:hypothetical protein
VTHTEEEWTQRLAVMALEAHEHGEPCIEHGCLMMAQVLRLPTRARLRMATVFMEFANTLEVLREE